MVLTELATCGRVGRTAGRTGSQAGAVAGEILDAGISGALDELARSR